MDYRLSCPGEAHGRGTKALRRAAAMEKGVSVQKGIQVRRRWGSVKQGGRQGMAKKVHVKNKRS